MGYDVDPTRSDFYSPPPRKREKIGVGGRPLWPQIPYDYCLLINAFGRNMPSPSFITHIEIPNPLDWEALQKVMEKEIARQRKALEEDETKKNG